jgi:hypothetical protein
MNGSEWMFHFRPPNAVGICSTVQTYWTVAGELAESHTVPGRLRSTYKNLAR